MCASMSVRAVSPIGGSVRFVRGDSEPDADDVDCGSRTHREEARRAKAQNHQVSQRAERMSLVCFVGKC